MKSDSIPGTPGPSAPVAAPARRKVIACIVAAAGGMAAGARAMAQAQQPAMLQRQGTASNAARTSLHYDIDFTASPERIYAALLDAKQFAAFSGLPAEIDRKEGGAFSLFGGQIVGRNVELVADQRIVQAWRPTHWAIGVYSLASFALKPRGSESTLSFDHTGFPAGEFDSLDWGWHHHYWEPLRKFLA
jgi:activator of HSP90 ATPase